MDGDDAVFVEPDAVEDESEELAFGVGVGFGVPEGREVLEDRAGLVEVRGRLGREGVEFGVAGVAAGEVLGAVEVA